MKSQISPESIYGSEPSSEAVSKHITKLSNANFAAASVAAGLDIMVGKSDGSVGKAAVIVIEQAIELQQKKKFEKEVTPVIEFISRRLIEHGTPAQNIIVDYLSNAHAVFNDALTSYDNGIAKTLGQLSRSMVAGTVEMLAKEAIHSRVAGLSAITLGGIARAVELDMIKYLFNASLNENEQHLHQPTVIGSVLGVIRKVTQRGEKIVGNEKVKAVETEVQFETSSNAGVEATIHMTSTNVTTTIEGRFPRFNPNIERVARDEGLEPVENQHITIIGYEEGRLIKAALMKKFNDAAIVEEELRKVFAEVKLEVFPIPEWYLIRRTYAKLPSEELRRAIVQRVAIAGSPELFEKLSALTGIDLELPDFHVTQFTNSTNPLRAGLGIGFRFISELYENGEVIENYYQHFDGEFTKGYDPRNDDE